MPQLEQLHHLREVTGHIEWGRDAEGIGRASASSSRECDNRSSPTTGSWSTEYRRSAHHSGLCAGDNARKRRGLGRVGPFKPSAGMRENKERRNLGKQNSRKSPAHRQNAGRCSERIGEIGCRKERLQLTFPLQRRPLSSGLCFGVGWGGHGGAGADKERRRRASTPRYPRS